MQIGKRDFQIGKATYIMGILNVTPDSFSDGGKYTNLEDAVDQAFKMVEHGADILDIGGESTRPGHTPISEKEEISRVVPIILALKEKLPDIPISIDTYKTEVCREAIMAGADLINDIWGFKYDNNMAKLVAKSGLPCCLMHNRSNSTYNNLLSDFLDDIEESVNIAIENGVKPENIILDPGLGFGKTYDHNLEIINNLEVIKRRFPMFPVLLGASRKSFIGQALGNTDTLRINATIATTVIGITRGCDFVRVHDVKENKEACLMTDAILRNND